jgi:hypothetical protein
MRNPLTVEDAIATLSHSNLPTVITEGRDDYRVLRRVEKRLTDVGVDFSPLSGRETVLAVWEQLPKARQSTVLALVDLDEWIYKGIPTQYVGDNLIYTVGYSIENDILLDCDIEEFLDDHEVIAFTSDLCHVSADHAIQIERCKSGQSYLLKRHVNEIINEQDKSPFLTPHELNTQAVLKSHFRQFMRGKSVFELIIRQTTKKGRHVNLNYKHLYEFASVRPGPILLQLERKIRHSFS